MRLIAPVGLAAEEGIPPHVAHVPIALQAAAPGARRAIHSSIVTERLAPPGAQGSSPSGAQWPPSFRAIVSSVIEPSSTITYGAPSVPASACSWGRMKFGPASTLTTAP